MESLKWKYDYEDSQRLDIAESLLEDAMELLDDVHCYETQVYKNIRKYLEGEDE